MCCARSERRRPPDTARIEIMSVYPAIAALLLAHERTHHRERMCEVDDRIETLERMQGMAVKRNRGAEPPCRDSAFPCKVKCRRFHASSVSNKVLRELTGPVALRSHSKTNRRNERG